MDELINVACGHLWQERFHSFPMDERHLIACVRYVELNPVRAPGSIGLVGFNVFSKTVNGNLSGFCVGQQCKNVIEQDAGNGEAGYGADMTFQVHPIWIN